jgi:hypothetical protein
MQYLCTIGILEMVLCQHEADAPPGLLECFHQRATPLAPAPLGLCPERCYPQPLHLRCPQPLTFPLFAAPSTSTLTAPCTIVALAVWCNDDVILLCLQALGTASPKSSLPGSSCKPGHEAVRTTWHPYSLIACSRLPNLTISNTAFASDVNHHLGRSLMQLRAPVVMRDWAAWPTPPLPGLAPRSLALHRSSQELQTR